MGVASFTLGKYGKYGGNEGRGNILSTDFRTSGSFTTSTSASNLEDASGDVTALAGEVLVIYASEAMWLRVGATAAVGTGIYLPEAETVILEVETRGTVSVIDVA